MSWGAVAGAVVGGGLGLMGANKAAKGADADRAVQMQILDRLGKVNFSPWGAQIDGTGFTGSGFNTGMFAPFLQQFQGGGLANFAQGQDLQNMANSGLLGIMGNQGALANQLGGMAAGQAQQLGTQGFQSGLQDILFGQAGNLAGQTDFSGLRDQTLATLREQAQPFEKRAFGDLQQNLFSTGNLGSSGGALQTEAFARGLGQADLSRQLQATGVAQQQQMQNANIANIFGGMGQGLRGLEDNLLNNAFSRFGQTTGLATDLNNQLFNRGSAGFNQGFQQLGGIGNIFSQLLDMGKFGANLGATDANTQIAAAGGQSNVAANFGPTGNDLWGGFMTSLGSNMLQGTDWSKIFSGFGGGGGAPSGGGGSTGGQGGFSDRRLKENLEHIGTDERGYKWYTWDWNSQAKLLGAHKYMPMGVIADEVLEVNPDAVMEDESGFLKVNYGAL